MLIFSAISKGSLILCDYGDQDEDLKQITQKQLKYVKKTQEMQILQSVQLILYFQDGYYLYVLQKQEHRFMCISRIQNDKLFSQQQQAVASQFLNSISEEYSQQSKNQEFDSGQFTKTLAERLKFYNLSIEKPQEMYEKNGNGQIQNGVIQQSDEYQQKTQYTVPQNLQKYQKNSTQYSVYTCKSIFFIINLIMAGMLVELLNSINNNKE